MAAPQVIENVLLPLTDHEVVVFPGQSPMNFYSAYHSDVEAVMQIDVKIATERMENRLFEYVDPDTVRYAAYLVAGFRHGLVCPAFPTAQPHAPYTTFKDHQKPTSQFTAEEEDFKSVMETLGKYLGPEDRLFVKRRLPDGETSRQDCSVMTAQSEVMVALSRTTQAWRSWTLRATRRFTDDFGENEWRKHCSRSTPNYDHGCCQQPGLSTVLGAAAR